VSLCYAVNKLIESNRLPHLLFHGPPGTGKTSTIIACAKKMFGEKYSSMTLELNASDDRGINVVRDQIKEFAGTKKLFRWVVRLVGGRVVFETLLMCMCDCPVLVALLLEIVTYLSSFLSLCDSTGVKLIILDEADAMTADAQAALRRGMCCVRFPLFSCVFFIFLNDYVLITPFLATFFLQLLKSTHPTPDSA
jgi:DNA polymerase III delta prime subunit